MDNNLHQQMEIFQGDDDNNSNSNSNAQQLSLGGSDASPPFSGSHHVGGVEDGSFPLDASFSGLFGGIDPTLLGHQDSCFTRFSNDAKVSRVTKASPGCAHFPMQPPRNHQRFLQLEKAQRELELQKQQLLARMQNPVGQAPSTGLPNTENTNNGGPIQCIEKGKQQARQQYPPHPQQQRELQATQQQQQQQQWHICRICNSQAFASHEEGMQHEAICARRNKNCRQQMGHMKQPPPLDPLCAMTNTNQRGNHQMLPTGDALFKPLLKPRPLAMISDGDWLTPLHCFVRENCVEVFSATEQDVMMPSRRKPIGQVGIRCPHCHGSVYYPTTISSIYHATMNLLERHLHSCKSVPSNIMEQYQTLLKADDARSGTCRKYWIESALSLGLVDSPQGICFSAGTPPPLPRVKSPSKRLVPKFHQGALVSSEDKAYTTEFSYHLLSQMRRCFFTAADSKRNLPAGFPGLACRHCCSGRFFPLSIKTLSDTLLDVLRNHMMRCCMCPTEVRETLEKLGAHHDEHSKSSQKAFFAEIWGRLHGTPGMKRKADHHMMVPLPTNPGQAENKKRRRMEFG